MTEQTAAWLRTLARAAAPVHGAPLRLCRCCVQALDVDGASVSVATADGVHAVCSTSARAERLADLQLTLGVGPTVDAHEQGLPVLVDDVRGVSDRVVERWPGFLASAQDAGVRAVFALPLRIGAIRIGVLELHRCRAGRLGSWEVRAAFLAADRIATALLDDEISRPGGHDAVPAWPGPRHALKVHQATGMVQAQLDMAARDALLALRARAFCEDRALTDVAADVVARRLRFSHEEQS